MTTKRRSEKDRLRRRQARRGFLGRLLALFPLAFFESNRRAVAIVENRRTLSFRHTHTGDELTVVYWSDGDYVPAALDRLNRFLGDFRTGDVTAIDPGLFDILYDVYAKTGSQGIYEVISGYRSPKTNEMLRSQGRSVARKSLHVQGKAIDVRLTDVTTTKVRDTALALGRGGVGYYGKSDFVHMDTGRVRRW